MTVKSGNAQSYWSWFMQGANPCPSMIPFTKSVNKAKLTQINSTINSSASGRSF